MNEISTTLADAIMADQQLARLATVDASDYFYFANNNGKGIDVKVSLPVEVKKILIEHCARKKQTQADFMRTATIDALVAELTAISKAGEGEALKDAA